MEQPNFIVTATYVLAILIIIAALLFFLRLLYKGLKWVVMAIYWRFKSKQKTDKVMEYLDYNKRRN